MPTPSGAGRDQRTGLELLDRALADLRSQFQFLLQLTLLRGVHLRQVELSAGTNRIAHGLRRKPQGWWITRIEAATPTIYEVTGSGGTDDKVLVLDAGGAITVDLWVFG